MAAEAAGTVTARGLDFFKTTHWPCQVCPASMEAPPRVTPDFAVTLLFGELRYITSVCPEKLEAIIETLALRGPRSVLFVNHGDKIDFSAQPLRKL